MSTTNTVGAIILTILGTLPALVILLVIFPTSACEFRGSSLLVTVAVFLACVTLLVARFLLLPRSSGDVETQTDDVESGNGTSGDEENNNMDAPPVYESVVSKPPPYEYLYVSACGDDPPPSSAATPENDGVLRQGEGPNATEQGCPDPDLPSYADIVGNPSSPE